MRKPPPGGIIDPLSGCVDSVDKDRKQPQGVAPPRLFLCFRGLYAQGHALDKEHLAKELGDIAWYLAEAATALDLPLESVFQANLDKLKKRYPDGFDTTKSQARLKGDL